MLEILIGKININPKRKNIISINLLDGVRVSYENSWGLLRASNTSPKLVLRFEGNSQDDLEDIKEKFETNLKIIFPDLELIYS